MKVHPVDAKEWIANLSMPLQQALGACHTVSKLPSGEMVGNEVETKMLAASEWQLWSDPKSPSKMKTLVPPACISDAGPLTVVRQLEFDHGRMTSGVVIRQADGTLRVFVKGSYEKVAALATGVPSDYAQTTEQHAADQFYVLGLSARTLADVDDATIIAATRDELESGLELIGLLLFRNEIKPDSGEVMQTLRYFYTQF